MKHCILIRVSKVPLWSRGRQSVTMNCRLFLVFLYALAFFGLSCRAAEHPANSSHITPGDPVDVPRFTEELAAPDATEPFRFLWKQFSSESKKDLQNPATEKDVRQTVLMKELNAVIAGGLIYDDSRFTGVKLSPETLRLAQHAQDDY